jgi:hypothetical protein
VQFAALFDRLPFDLTSGVEDIVARPTYASAGVRLVKLPARKNVSRSVLFPIRPCLASLIGLVHLPVCWKQLPTGARVPLAVRNASGKRLMYRPFEPHPLFVSFIGAAVEQSRLV